MLPEIYLDFPLNEIPPIIHQTWKNETVPEKWVESYESYNKLDGFQYVLWTDKMNRELIETHFPEYLKLYDSYKYPIQRADMVRYFILYKYGGIYSDLDISPIPQKFEDMYETFKNGDVVLAECNEKTSFANQNLTNAFMMSRKESGFWKVVWGLLRTPFKENSWKYILSDVKYFHVLFTTGPGIISDASRKYENVDIISYKLIQPSEGGKEAAVKILEGSSWHSSDDSKIRKAGDSIKDSAGVMLVIGISILGILVMSGFIIYSRFSRKSKI